MTRAPTKAWFIIACAVIAPYALASYWVFKLNPYLAQWRLVRGPFDLYLVLCELLGLPLMVSWVVQACAIFDTSHPLPRWLLDASAILIVAALLNVLPFVVIGVIVAVFSSGLGSNGMAHMLM